MAKPGSVKVVEVCRVAPKPSSPPNSAHPEDLSVPLTFFDIHWLRFPPPQHLFFYNMPSFDTSHFFDSVLPKLKTSLSATLQHFVPLAGNLIWPLDSSKPLLSYVKGDAVSLTFAESDADFHHLISSNNFDIEAKEYHPLVPQLAVSHDKAAVLALQITVFPNDGFSIGSAMHHAACDGVSAVSFFKFWGHFCKHGEGGLPPLPSHNRKVIKDPSGLQAIFSNDWLRQGGPNNRSLMLLEVGGPGDGIRGTFEFTRAKIEMLRRQVRKRKVNILTYLLVLDDSICDGILANLYHHHRDGVGTLYRKRAFPMFCDKEALNFEAWEKYFNVEICTCQNSSGL